MNIYILGAAGWIPGCNETNCIMVEHNNELYILDAGSGIANLKKYPNILVNYNMIYLILSHYHLDHIIGLAYLEPFVSKKRLRIYGPGKTAYPETTDYYVRALLRKEFFSKSIDDFTDDIRCIDFPSDSFYIGKTKIKVRVQHHTAPSFCISMDDKLIYATDTTFEDDKWKETNAALLLHECWEYEQSNGNGHTSLWQLKNQLPLNQFGKVVLIHQNPVWNNDDFEEIEKMISGTNIYLANDGMHLKV